jgi:hypothetical protein
MHDHEKNEAQRFRLAATDIFVEKAQCILTGRGRFLASWGALMGVMAFGCFICPAYYIYQTPLSTVIDNRQTIDGYILTLILVKASTVGGLLVAAAVFAMHLCRAFFHEATILFNRRHALRFGRLYVYLYDGQIILDEIEKAFKWSDEFSTAFQDIKPEHITPKSPTQVATEAVVKATNGAANIVKTATDGMSKKSSDSDGG